MQTFVGPAMCRQAPVPAVRQRHGGGQPMQGQPMQGQPMQGQPMQGQPMQGQPMQGQATQGQAERRASEGAVVCYDGRCKHVGLVA